VYDSAEAGALFSIQQALQSSPVLTADRQELPAVWGILAEPISREKKLLRQAIDSSQSDKPCWLRPLESIFPLREVRWKRR